MLRRRNYKHYIKHKEQARMAVHARLAFFNAYYGHALRRVFIKNSKSRWGSCSSAGNLNFNYKLIFLPPEVLDYVVVHELAHLRVMDHSPRFWAEVAAVLPDYAQLRRRLREETAPSWEDR